MKLSRPIVIALFCVLSAALGESARACSCAGWPSPCAAYEEAAAVFVGRVTRVEPERSQGGGDQGEQTAYVQVEEAFKGAGVGAEFVFRQPGHNCAPKFRAGERLLFYAHYHEKEKTWEVFGCGRTAPVENAGDDLLYLRGLPESATRTRLSGALKHYEDDPQKGFSLVSYVAGAKVRITGGKTSREALTDSNGVFEIYDLPPGIYTIEPETPFGLKLLFPMSFGPPAEPGPPDPARPASPNSVTVELTERGCAGSNYLFSSDTVISGRVLGPRGEPLPEVCLELKPLVKKPDPYFRVFDCTGEDGSYRLDTIPPGKYLIEVNDDGRLSGDEPFPALFYPGVFEKEKAGVVTVGVGARLEGHDIIIPRLLPTRTLRGVLVYADGQPVANESVAFEVEGQNGRYEESQRARTDEQGRFALKVLRETAGSLSGSMHVYPSKFAAVCPEVKRLLQKNGDRMVAAQTRPVRIEAGRDVNNLKLALPFPSCPLAPKERD